MENETTNASIPRTILCCSLHAEKTDSKATNVLKWLGWRPGVEVDEVTEKAFQLSRLPSLTLKKPMGSFLVAV